MDLRCALPEERDNRRGRRMDLLLAAVSLAGGLLMYKIDLFTDNRFGARVWLLVPLAVCCAALVLRRTAPLPMLLIGTAGVVADGILGPSLATVLVYTQILYDACVYGRRGLDRALLWVAGAGAVVAGAIAVVVTRDLRGLGIAVLLVILTVLPVLTGIHVRFHRDQARAERQRAEQLTRLAELDRANAVAGERARMARELHDVIANHLSAVAIHATAALTVTNLGAEGIRHALTVIRENSVRGLAEMRQMIEFLRDPEPSGTPGDAATPGLGELTALLDRIERAGLPARLRVTGEPRELPVAVDLAGYRIVQESLTNALKHGGSGGTDIELAYGPGQITITVDSPLPRDAAVGAPINGGAGVIGMRERALLLGGDFAAGPDGGRWLVSARLPTAAPGLDEEERAA